MRLIPQVSALAVALHLGSGTWALHARQDAATPPEPAAVVARSYIIEYADRGVGLRRLPVPDGVVVDKTFESDIFAGARVETDTYSPDDLGRLPGVARVWANERIKLAPPPVDPKLAALEDAPVYYTHNATGVGRLHKQGVFGKGVKIAVVDSGIWYDHPALGGGFGPGFKVAGGHDFVGDGDWPGSGPKTPDEDPRDQDGHGTHVAGIVAGQLENWTGVAPEATLYAYKVFGKTLDTDLATVIDAFLAAYADGVDIITCSIRWFGGWQDNVWAELANRLVEEGIVVTIAAGNEGGVGPFFASNGAAGTNVLAVASTEDESMTGQPFTVTFHPASGADGEAQTSRQGYMPYSNAPFPPTVVDWPVVSLNPNSSAVDDGCSPYPADTPSLAGKIALVRRGGCDDWTKQENLVKIGAGYVLIYSDEPALAPVYYFPPNVALVTAELGASIIETIVAGGDVTASFDLEGEEHVPVSMPSATGSRPSDFTSWGALYDLHLKPDVAAPGGDIFSTYRDGGYATLSGTSMATPYVAGVAALYISVHGGREKQGKGFARRLVDRIISSGASVPHINQTSYAATDFAASPAQVGTGLIDAFKVVHSTTELSFQRMALNDTVHFNPRHQITVTNSGPAAVTYQFSAQPAAGFDSVGLGDVPGAPAPVRRVKQLLELQPRSYEPVISLPGDLTLMPAESKTVSVDFANPDTLGWDAAGIPLYGGKIIVLGSNGEQLSVPYLGVAADLKNDLGNIIESGYPRLQSTDNDTSIEQKSWYTFNLPKQDFPVVKNKLIWGTRQLRWDIFEASWTEQQWSYPLEPGKAGYVGAAAVSAEIFNTRDDIRFRAGVHDPNKTTSFPLTDVPRDYSGLYSTYAWFGGLGNGSLLANGTYTMRFAALRPFGNPENDEDWDVYRAPQIQVLGQYTGH